MIAALLSWFDEFPEWLADLVASLPQAGVGQLVACDGAYASFPGARPRSDDKEHRHLIRACKRANLPLTLHVPSEPWVTEMEKRTHLFRLAETVTNAHDWYLVVDADERITRAPPDLPFELANTNLDVAEATLSEPHPQASTKTFPMRMLFRAIRGLRVETNHYTYLADDRKLWGRGRQEPCLDLTDTLVVEHRTVCKDCEPQIQAENRKAVTAHGLNYDTIQVTMERVPVPKVVA